MEIKAFPGSRGISKLHTGSKSVSKNEKTETKAKEGSLVRKDSIQLSAEYEAFSQKAKGQEEDTDLADVLSDLLKDMEKDVKDINKQKDFQQEWASRLEDLENAKKSGEEASKAFKDETDAFRIALLYGSGKAVNPKDLEFLKEKNPKAYVMAIAMRSLQKIVEEDKKKKSIRGEEKEEQGDNGMDAMKDAIQESFEKKEGLEAKGMNPVEMNMEEMEAE